MLFYTTISILSVVVITLGVVWWVLQPSEPNLPPLAPGHLPVVGHLLTLSTKEPLEKLFLKWSREVGPIFTLKLGVKHWIIINDAATVKDLIVNRGTIYSSRDVSSTIVNGLFEGETGGGFAFYEYGKCWRNLRRIAHSGLTKQKVDDYQPIFEQGTRLLLQVLSENVAQAPGASISLCPYLEDYALLSILKVAYGDIMTLKPGDEELQKVFELTAEAATFLGPKEQLLEFFPILKWIFPPNATFVKYCRTKVYSFYGQLFKTLEEKLKIDPENVNDCFFKEVAGKLTLSQKIGFSAVFVGAGSETTASTLQWIFAILTNNPEIQDKVYEEINSVVGRDRLPTAEDESNLPYLQCVILETLRLWTPTPLGVPHATSSEDVYNNYVIPAKATVVINAYSIHRDPNRYDEPNKFDPTRHMDYVKGNSGRRFKQNVDDRPHLAFSTGRRVCVGIHLAERSLYMATAALVACYRFEGSVDVSRSKGNVSTTYSPIHYHVRLVPRHDAIHKLIQNS
ncbi:cytochrome P450 [Umbelopsis sp. PMI_123]|nr:cytochrome P450 [Umbelopsis sp. PMI_123]